MTLNGAIMELVMLSEHPMMPVIFKPSIQKIIETVSECEESERKTGKWLDIKLFGISCIKCSECNFTEMDIPEARSKFCQNCGARMEG